MDMLLDGVCIKNSKKLYSWSTNISTKIGALSFQGDTSDQLMQVTLPILTDQQCSDLTAYEGDIDTDKQVKNLC